MEGESEVEGDQQEEGKGSVAFIWVLAKGIYSSAHTQ